MITGILQIEKFVEGLAHLVPGISMDCVVLGYKEKKLHVLLLALKGGEVCALPGGFLGHTETLEDAVDRVLYERTGIKDIFLQQFYTFSSLERAWNQDALERPHFDDVFQALSEASRAKIKAWLSQRFITTGFLALLDANVVKPTPDILSDRCTFVPIDSLPRLILDHQKIIEMALFHLRIQLNYWPIGKSLLPERFTMLELQMLYEAILRKPLDRGNFQRKMRKLNVLKRHEKLMTGAANKAPYLYSFDDRVYYTLLKEGIGFV